MKTEGQTQEKKWASFFLSCRNIPHISPVSFHLFYFLDEIFVLNVFFQNKAVKGLYERKGLKNIK